MVWISSALGIGWLVFLVYWFLSATQSKRTIKNNTWWRGVTIRVVILVFAVWFFDGYSATHSLNFFSSSISSLNLGLIGLVLWALGIGFAVWARIYLGRNWGMPMSIKENPELVTNGPYYYVRHPIYSGVLLAMIGSVFANGTWWLVSVIVFGIYFIYSAVKEDAIMARIFPAQYPEYKKKTKMLIPFVL